MPIDIHAHYVPHALIDKVRSAGREFGVELLTSAAPTPALRFEYGFQIRPMFPKLIEPAAQRIAWLDERGIDRQLVATWPDIYGYGLGRQQCATWHRALNDTLGAWCADHAERFSWLASVPMPNAEDAAAELERALGQGAVGVMVAANVEGVNLGEVALDPFWKKAAALGAPVMIHPVLVTAAPRAAKFALTQIVQYTFDTTLGVGSLLFSGVLDRFPGLTLVLSHGGGAFPYLAGRFDLMHARMDRAAQGNVASEPPSAYLGRMAYDTIVHAPRVLRFLADQAGVGQVALGTDYSFPPADLDPLATVRAAGFSSREVEAITEANPRRLFPRLPAH
jgi:aminocarboxymuconate-semialdehyde decarboxylase